MDEISDEIGQSVVTSVTASRSSHISAARTAYPDDAARELHRRGYRAQRLEDGYPEWKQAGLPLAAGDGG